jgi:hypothetical protein
MGTITRSFANNLTTGGVLKADAFNNASLNNVTALNAAIATGNMVLLSSQTASASASISFTTGIDSTFKEYQFYFIDIHPATNNVNFTFQGNSAGGSGFDETITSTFFQALHFEADNEATIEYEAGGDLSQSTSFQQLVRGLGNGNDESCIGTLSLFNPSSTTFVKHFISNCSGYEQRNGEFNSYIAGYFNTTSAIDEIQFKMSSGNIDDGTILMFGIN